MLAHVQAGSRDLERAAEALATRLPEPLGVLARLAYNYRWAWDPDGPDLSEDTLSRALDRLSELARALRNHDGRRLRRAIQVVAIRDTR